MLTPWRLLLCQLAVRLSYHVVTASLCLGGSDIFARVRENSPAGEFIANLSIKGDPGANIIRLCLSGDNADWFFLEGQTIRLNSSFSRALDREVQGPILMAQLTCYEDDIIRGQYRVMVEVLNENDNKPQFLEKTIQPFYVSELTAVNSTVFTVTAVDADGDIISYIIDKSSPDASYFRIDLPNSGKVLLDKPLDYETKTQLQLVMHAVESNTREKYNTTATLTVNIRDEDDQYPQFLPCTPVSQDKNISVCTNPVYTANITENDQDMILGFSPGPIHAEDGDRTIETPLAYAILSGADHGRFLIDNQTGEITLTRPVENRQLTPTFSLLVMASQLNDPKKYSVATALVRVLAKNRFPPLFNRTTYKGFVIESSSPATIISTYGNQVLLLQAIDKDFKDGVNPKMHYSLQSLPTRNGLYHITQEGVLIAKTDRLRAFDRHILEVVAMDEESGEVVTASVDIEVLQRGQPVPRGPFEEERLFVDIDTRLAGGIAGTVLFVVVLFLLLRMVKRRRRRRRDAAEQDSIACGKHPNVVNSNQPVHLMEMSYNNEAFIGEYETSRSADLQGRKGLYIRKQSVPLPPSGFPGSEQQESGSRPLNDLLPNLGMPEPLHGDLAASLQPNGRTRDKTSGKDATVKDKMLERVKEGTETECFPTIKEEQRVEREQTVGMSAGAAALVQGNAGGRPNTDKLTT